MRAVVLSLIVLAAVPVRGDLLLDLEYTDGTIAKSVSSGDVVMVNLILRDPSDDTFLSLEGLSSGGGALVQTAGTAVVTPAAPPVAGPEFDPLFTVPSPPATAPRPGLLDSVLTGNFLPAGLGTTDVLLATFSFMATGVAGDTATIHADVVDPGHVFVANETFTSATDLDSLLTDLSTTPGNFGFVDLMISPAVVPEPSTLLVGGLIVVGGLVWRRRKSADICEN